MPCACCDLGLAGLAFGEIGQPKMAPPSQSLHISFLWWAFFRGAFAFIKRLLRPSDTPQNCYQFGFHWRSIHPYHQVSIQFGSMV